MYSRDQEKFRQGARTSYRLKHLESLLCVFPQHIPEVACIPNLADRGSGFKSQVFLVILDKSLLHWIMRRLTDSVYSVPGSKQGVSRSAQFLHSLPWRTRFAGWSPCPTPLETSHSGRLLVHQGNRNSFASGVFHMLFPLPSTLFLCFLSWLTPTLQISAGVTFSGGGCFANSLG